MGIQSRTLNREKGFSLVELMVSMLLGLILMAGVLEVMVDSMRTGSQIRLSGDVADNGRYLVNLIREEVSVAGFYGELDDYDTGATAQPNPCNSISTANMVLGMTYPLNGRDSAYVDQSNFSCAQAIYPRSDTDILVIRRASTIQETGSLNSNRYYLQTTPTQYVLDTGASSAFTLTLKDGVTAAPIREFYQTIYYVRSNEDFYRYRVYANGNVEHVPIASGVRDFQVEYGIDRSGNGSPNADGADAAWVEAPTDDEWDDVVAVRFYFLVRSLETKPGGAREQKTYTYADVSVSPSNAYEYGLFSSSAQVTNVAVRRLVQ